MADPGSGCGCWRGVQPADRCTGVEPAPRADGLARLVPEIAARSGKAIELRVSQEKAQGFADSSSSREAPSPSYELSTGRRGENPGDTLASGFDCELLASRDSHKERNLLVTVE